MPWTGTPPTRSAAQIPIQSGLECLQGWGINSSLGSLLLYFTTLIVMNFFFISNLNLPFVLSLKPLFYFTLERVVIILKLFFFFSLLNSLDKMGHLQLLWATVTSASPPSQGRISLTSNLNHLSFIFTTSQIISHRLSASPL